MKTVLEELEEDIYKLKESKCYINPNNFARDVINLINYYKEKEKEQIIDAYCECWENDGGNGFNKVNEATEYFNNKYKTVSK